jgi:hypothetical protein
MPSKSCGSIFRVPTLFTRPVGGVGVVGGVVVGVGGVVGGGVVGVVVGGVVGVVEGVEGGRGG